jgi:cytochrome c-type biogenesis protein CcmH
MNTFVVVAALMAAVAAAAVALPLMRDRHSRLIGAVAAVAIAGSAAGLYPLWSNWNWHAPVGQAASPDVLAMVSKLENHLRDDPQDLTGWLMLGRSDLALERLDEAIVAYDHAHRLDAGNVDAVLGLGEALSLRAGGNITAPAAELFEAAVKLAPDNPKALLYGGFAAMTRGDNAGARARWQALKDLHPPEQIEKMLDDRIAALGNDAPDAGAATPGAGTNGGAMTAGAPSAVARSANAPRGAGIAATPIAPTPQGGAMSRNSSGGAAAISPGSTAATVTVNISLAPALKSRLTRDAPLFVFAREPGVPGPPLAAKRLTSAAIGTQIQLSAADSMVPGRVLLSGRPVSITARVSFSGQPLPSAGDLYGELTYDVGRDGARNLVIDRVAE